MRGDHAAAAVHADDETIAELVQGRLEKIAGGDGGRTHDHPVDAGLGDARETRGAAHATAVLHGDVERRDDAFDGADVGHLAGARRIEVDDVQRLGAFGLPAPRQLHGVIAEHGDVIEVPAPQAYGLAALYVHRRKDDHEACTSLRTRSTNPASRRSPVRELFSG